MNIILSIFLLCSSVFALSSLPYANLNTQLMDAQKRLQKLSNDQSLPIREHYIKKYYKLTKYADSILKDSNIEKNEAKLYLKKLRELDSVYEEVLSITRANASKAIIVNTNLPRFFENSSFTQSSVNYYKRNKKFQESDVMQKELEYDKAKKNSKKAQESSSEQVMMPQQTLSKVPSIPLPPY